MDQFEAARLKHAKNKERKERVALSEPAVDSIEPTEEKPKSVSPDALIEVRVTLPTGEFSIYLVRTNVLSNVAKVKLNKREFTKALLDGLQPLLGGLKETNGDHHPIY